MAAQSLVFQETQFDVVDQNGQPWLKAADIARALGYKKADAVTQIYERNADEFSDAMSQTLNLRVSGKINGLQSVTVRIFSLRGAHLIAMFARTAVAKAFRKWVLDILDKVVETATVKSTADTRTPLRQAVSALVSKRGMMYPEAYAIVHQRFGVEHLDQLTDDQVGQAVEYVHRLTLEGEWLPRQEAPKAAATLSESEAFSLHGLFISVREMRQFWTRIEPALREVQSPLAARYHDQFADVGFSILALNDVERRCAEVYTKRVGHMLT